ncbi:MAG: efflux RND transporter permease subunit [Paludibacteraceae bacterium]|nr:efflux RND transporter permease subunit [Paludibacteraceae bacterium]
MKTRNHIEAAMRSHRMVFFVVAVLCLFGIYALVQMNKDEFPQVTIRQAVVAAIYPGATAQEIEQQVTYPLEECLFSYEEINKEFTYSTSKDGVVYIITELNQSVKRKDEVWAKIRTGLDMVKKTKLPQGVLAVAVIDDFGNTSSMLLAIESEDHNPRELNAYAKTISNHLRTIPEMGKIKILGEQTEQIVVDVDIKQLARYGIDQKSLFAMFATQGLRTVSGTTGAAAGHTQLHIDIPFDSEYEIAEQIVYTDPVTQSTVRLKDIATIQREYKEGSYIDYYEQDRASAVMLSIEMQPGHNIVQFGDEVDKQLAIAAAELPADVRMHRVTDQPKVVNDSVVSFLKDILISILVVVAVMLLLFPLKTAVVASTGVPICTAITIGVMYIFGLELNTVTLAALIVVLGMIVDNSVIVVDGYCNTLQTGHSRWFSAATQAKELYVPTLIATVSIFGMFFPMKMILDGLMGEFVKDFPWAVMFALMASFFYAFYVTPYLSTRFIKRQKEGEVNFFERGQNWFFGKLEHAYEKVLRLVFRIPVTTLVLTFGLMAIGLVLFLSMNVQMLPKADRSCFAVEIHLKEGCSVAESGIVADSLARVLNADPRVVNVTSFVGMSSPRFHAAYAPQMPMTNYAQLIVNTTSNKATEQVLKDYTERFENAFPNAYARFKQMDYQICNNPFEVCVQGPKIEDIEPYADSIKQFMMSCPELMWVHSNYDETRPSVRIRLNADEAARLGVSQTFMSLYLSNIFNGQTITTFYEQNNAVPVVLRASGIDTLDYKQLEDVLVPTIYPGVSVPLRQIATIEPEWHHATIGHINGVPTITIGCDLKGNASEPKVQKKVQRWIEQQGIDKHVTIFNDGLTGKNKIIIPQAIYSIIGALLVMFFVLLYHFGKLSLSLLTLSSALLTLFGAFLGMRIFGMVDFSITAILGIVSLIGVIVRNAIIMYEYAEELRVKQHMSGRDAAFQAGIRRMRPIFLTSATTALGVIPMIIARTSLWMPMGVVICFGTIFTLPLVVTILPIAYWKFYAKD